MRKRKESVSKDKPRGMWKGIPLAGLVIAVFAFLFDRCSDYWRQAPILRVVSLAIYQEDDEGTPTCKIAVEVINPEKDPRTINFDSIFILGRLGHVFTAENSAIRLQGESREVYPVVFRDSRLRELLRAPVPDTNKRLVSVSYSIVGDDSPENVTVDTSAVVQCNYWQDPIFASDSEALGYGLAAIRQEGILWFTEESGNTGADTLLLDLYRPKSELPDVNLQIVGDAFAHGYLMAPVTIRPTTFLRRYGGIYAGRTANSLYSRMRSITPAEYFVDSSDPMLSAVKQNLEAGLGDLPRQFILYRFDDRRRDSTFAIYEENSGVLLAVRFDGYGRTETVDSIAESQGFRCVFQKGLQFHALPSILYTLPFPEKRVEFGKLLNRRIDDYNQMVDSNGVLFIWPQGIVDARVDKFCQRAASILKKERYRIIGFDCRPLAAIFPQAPYAEALLAVVHDSTDRDKMSFDSIILAESHEGVVTWSKTQN